MEDGNKQHGQILIGGQGLVLENNQVGVAKEDPLTSHNPFQLLLISIT